jgi:hypothetical protein
MWSGAGREVTSAGYLVRSAHLMVRSAGYLVRSAHHVVGCWSRGHVGWLSGQVSSSHGQVSWLSGQVDSSRGQVILSHGWALVTWSGQQVIG